MTIWRIESNCVRTTFLSTCPISRRDRVVNDCYYGDDYLNMTLSANYDPIYREVLDSKGLMFLNGNEVDKTLKRLWLAVKLLGTKPTENMFDLATGNAGYILNMLYQAAKEHPDGIWFVGRTEFCHNYM